MEETIWLCGACGKRSHDLYGEKPIDRGFDASCSLNAIKVYAQPNERGNYIPVREIDP